MSGCIEISLLPVSVSHHRNADSISFFVLIIMGEVWVVSGSPPELDRSGRISAL
jgi:hypothetical protein